MKVICTDDKNRPNELPASHWIKEGEIYTVVQCDKMKMQGGLYGYKLAEINIDNYSPFEYFDARRFNPYIGPAVDVALKVEELLAA